MPKVKWDDKKVVSHQLIEVRYPSNPRVMDLRGAVAESLRDGLGMEHWRVDNERADAFDQGEPRRAYVALRNFGFTARQVPTEHYFADQARKFIRFLYAHEKEPWSPVRFSFNRVGVRSMWLTPFQGEIADLAGRLSEQFAPIPEGASEAIGSGSRLLDTAVIRNMSDKHGNFNLVVASVTKDQVKDTFGKGAELPDVGLIVDVDYWTEPKTRVSYKELSEFLKDAAAASWNRHERIRNLVYEA